MKFWQESYFNRQNWILENIKLLKLSSKENLVLLLINFFIEQKREINLQILSEYCNLTEEEVDAAINLLSTKGFLQVQLTGKILQFSIDSIFQVQDLEQEEKIKELFEVFEEEFGRPLSQRELEQLQKWMKQYERSLIINALREASVLNKLSFQYIDQILFSIQRKQNESK